MAAALQLQRDAGLMASNLQVLGQYVTSLNRMSSEVMRLAFGPEHFPSEAVNVVAAPGTLRRHPDVSYGLMATTGWPRRSWADACVIL